jgi:hypothetical protein
MVAQMSVRFHGVQAVVLQLIGGELCRNADAPPFVGKAVNKNAFTILGNVLQCQIKLLTAVTF